MGQCSGMTPEAGAEYARTMRRAVVVLAAIVSGAALAGCGASTKITRVGGVIEIGGGVKSSALAKSVLGVRGRD